MSDETTAEEDKTTIKRAGLPITREECSFYVTVTPETHVPVRGNAQVSGDEADDRKVEDEILEQLQLGNTYAWCTAKVQAFSPRAPGLEGVDVLGCISCKGKQEFNDLFLREMEDRAVDALNQEVAAEREKEKTKRVERHAPRMLELLKELALVPNKHRPDGLWAEVNRCIDEAEGKVTT